MKFSVLILSISFILASCGTDNGDSQAKENQTIEEKIEPTYTKKQIQDLKTASKVVYNLPSPSEMAELLHVTNTIYDVEALNDPKASNKYYTDVSRALNLGGYFADLSFTSMFDYPQQAMLLMSAAQGLSEDLNIVGVFTEELMTRLEDNLMNKDSIMDIVSVTYVETDFYLQENGRSVIAKAILAGAWIEGLYIATNLQTKDNNNNAIWGKIGEQKDALVNLINMIDDCNEPQLQPLLEKLRDLQEAFSLIKIENPTGIKDTSKTNASLIEPALIPKSTMARIALETKKTRDHIVSTK